MIVTKKAISRRTILRGLGATVALPLLDAMIPAPDGFDRFRSSLRLRNLAWSLCRTKERFTCVFWDTDSFS